VHLVCSPVSDVAAPLTDDFYEAWNRHDAAGVGATFVAGGTYVDPLTGVELEGAKLTDHVQSVLGVIRDLRITVLRTISADDTTAAVWRIEGTWDGKLGLLTASGAAVRFEGTDVFDFGDGAFQRVRRSFDQLAVADALRLQTIVEPFSEGALTFGHSMRSWVSKEKPRALGLTWLLARDETEKLAIRARARDIINHFRDMPGFIGIVTGFAGLHGFTLTAWESEEALRAATHSGPHSEAMHAFRQDGLSGGVFTSVWEPVRLNRMWLRCPRGHPNDATRADGKCEVCGEPLPSPEPYL
jgi:heme-degrading monooxygenase HmoA